MTDHLVVRVAEIVEETKDIRTLRLEKLDGAPFTPFEAGAHIDVVGPTGVLRQYSLASSPHDNDTIVIAVKREPDSRGGSTALHTVAVGDHLRIGKPRNLLAIAEDADRHVLVAGGVGVTPLLAMAYDLYSRGETFELHYFARSEQEMAFRELLEQRAEFRDWVHLYFGVSIEEQGRILAGVAGELTDRSHVYTCGPAPFMDQVSQLLGAVVGADRVHIEHFAASAETTTEADTAFTVELDTGEVFEIPADRSILSVLEENGIEVFKSCEEGICGSCVSGVLEGVPDHRDHCLSASDKAAGDQMALCVSRAKTDKLLIELY
ncbi:PDR/VanB family oxidoreductase [Nocardioides sp.]|uniref:PDR/VanB family oxidoreductase n=1 Tax=Nocardioides sp. TaxID=35761 RepID=UPI0039E4FEFE